MNTATIVVEGFLEITDKKHGFLRNSDNILVIKPKDPFVSKALIDQYQLREGLILKGEINGKRGQSPVVSEILMINGRDPEVYLDIIPFDDLTAVDPDEQLILETGREPYGMRIIDIMCPIGKGQRGLIVAPPRTGKTILMQQIANSIAENYPDLNLFVVLIDERPEEVTEMRRTIKGTVLASSNDQDVDRHVRLAKMTLAKVKRLVEFGEDVVLLLDSITRMGRAFNSATKSSGRTLSGGLDIKGLQFPKQYFGAARTTEEGGSLTIIATALIETGSRMDEIIFQEFKGTGNMEMVLDQGLANRRIYPAINVPESGTRKEERLIGSEKIEKLHRLRRFLNDLPVGQDVQTLLSAMKKHDTNASFIEQLP